MKKLRPQHETVKAQTSRRKLIWVVIIDLVIVLAALHIQELILGDFTRPAPWYLVLVKAFQGLLSSLYDLDIDPIYATIRGLAVVWLWVSLFRSIISVILIFRKRAPLYANFLWQLALADAIAAIVAIPLYVR